MNKKLPLIIAIAGYTPSLFAQALAKRTGAQISYVETSNEDESKDKYEKYLNTCNNLNVEHMLRHEAWQDHLDEINEAIDYKGYYP